LIESSGQRFRSPVDFGLLEGAEDFDDHAPGQAVLAGEIAAGG
jgi:hypothetical protein